MKHAIINFRVTQAEKEAFHKAANAEGLSLTEYLKEAARYKEFCKMYFQEAVSPKEFHTKCKTLFKFTERSTPLEK